MKKITAFALITVIGFGLSLVTVVPASTNEDSKENRKELPAGQDRVMIPVKGMTCGGCAASIDRSVKKLDGILDVEIDHLKGSVTVVRVTEKVTVDEIVEAINKTGFKASKPKVS